MYRNLFTAWYCLGVLALCLVTFLVLTPFFGREADRAFSVGFAWTGLLGFLPFFWFVVFRKEQEDERDILIRQRSVAVGCIIAISTIFPLASLIACVFQFQSIPINFMFFPLHCGMIVGTFACSTTLLYLYYKGTHRTWRAA